VSKYKAKKVKLDGYTFDSKKEAARYGQLKGMLAMGVIEQLEVHPRYPLEVNGVLICTYVADFRYVVVMGRSMIVEDVKGFRTDVYRLKKKLMKAVLSIEVQEV